MITQLSPYSTKLLDPRWQQKRLHILERDSWTCQRCANKTSTLVVHHNLYLPLVEPWDCPNRFLITLCEPCHKQDAIDRAQYEQRLVKLLRELFSTYDLRIITKALKHRDFQLPPELVSLGISWLLTTPSVQWFLINKYFQFQRAKSGVKSKREEDAKRRQIKTQSRP